MKAECIQASNYNGQVFQLQCIKQQACIPQCIYSASAGNFGASRGKFLQRWCGTVASQECKLSAKLQCNHTWRISKQQEYIPQCILGRLLATSVHLGLFSIWTINEVSQCATSVQPQCIHGASVNCMKPLAARSKLPQHWCITVASPVCEQGEATMQPHEVSQCI